MIQEIKPTRELCKHCSEWSTQEDVGPNGISGCCHAAFGTRERAYMLGETDKCPSYFHN